MADIHINDVGTLLEVTIKENRVVADISSATAKILYIQRPDGVMLTKTPVFTTNGTDGKLRYTSIAGDFPIKGTYKVQFKLTLPTWEGFTEIGSFKVLSNLI